MTRPLLQSMTLEGFLSYGPGPVTIPLTPCNVLIGPNGSGKSNLIEALSVMRAVPRDLPLPIRRGGGVRDWLWKGERNANEARIELLFHSGHVAHASVRYLLSFGAQGYAFFVLDERVENATPTSGEDKPYFYFGYENGRPVLNVAGQERRELRREDIDPTQSI